MRAGRFKIDELDLAVAVTAGTALAYGQLLHEQPYRDDAAATDRVTEDLLRMFGAPANEARRTCRLPLPDPIAPRAHDGMAMRPSSFVLLMPNKAGY